MDKDVVTRAFAHLGRTKEEARVARRTAQEAQRRFRFRPLYAGVLVWAGVFGLLWVFG